MLSRRILTDEIRAMGEYCVDFDRIVGFGAQVGVFRCEGCDCERCTLGYISNCNGWVKNDLDIVSERFD